MYHIRASVAQQGKVWFPARRNFVPCITAPKSDKASRGLIWDRKIAGGCRLTGSGQGPRGPREPPFSRAVRRQEIGM